MPHLFEDPKYNVIITKHFDVHQDWEIPIPGFFIIATKDRSQNSIAEFSDEKANEFIRVLKKLREGMKEVLKIEKVRLWQNEDSKYNFHVWVFPRHQWMDEHGKFMKSLPGIVEYAKKNMVNDKVFKEVEEYAAKMKEYMKEFK
ncbi:hypothetical protein KKA15_03250 [Patescibacteria group bacterium]|nr:hypothetical protein [Patescibacteria group bacterium]